MEQKTGRSTTYVLVVEDQAIIRAWICSILESRGYNTLEAGDTYGALSVLQLYGQAIRLLFTDVRMPGGDDGLVLAHRCSVQWPHIGIVIASACVPLRSDQLPPRAVLVSKPFDERDVLEAICRFDPLHSDTSAAELSSDKGLTAR